MILTLLLLLIIFQIKHFVADYLLQGEYMLQKFKEKGWVKPLLAHVLVHGFFTGFICLIFCPQLMLLMILLDMSIHFIMDRLKASPKLLGRFKPIAAERMKEILFHKNWNHGQLSNEMKKEIHSNKWFWWSLGIDQMVHHLTHYIIIICILIWRK